MTETMAKDDVLEKIKEVLCEALNIDMDDIHLESTLMGNLGAESIDFLDIVFRLEKKFNIKIPRGEFFPEHFFDYTQNIDFKTGRLTKKGLDEVRRIPFFDISKFKDNEEIMATDLFTVNMLLDYICQKLGIN